MEVGVRLLCHRHAGVPEEVLHLVDVDVRVNQKGGEGPAEVVGPEVDQVLSMARFRGFLTSTRWPPPVLAGNTHGQPGAASSFNLSTNLRAMLLSTTRD